MPLVLVVLLRLATAIGMLLTCVGLFVDALKVLAGFTCCKIERCLFFVSSSIRKARGSTSTVLFIWRNCAQPSPPLTRASCSLVDLFALSGIDRRALLHHLVLRADNFCRAGVDDNSARNVRVQFVDPKGGALFFVSCAGG